MTRNVRSQRMIAMAIVLAVLGADQASKAVALLMLQDRVVAVGPIVDLRLGFNHGVVFGLFPAESLAGRIAIILATAGVALAVTVWLLRSVSMRRIGALALILGGALGNILDRVRAGAVTDFIDLHVGTLRWPTFNLADCAIVAGVAALLLVPRGRGGVPPRTGAP